MKHGTRQHIQAILVLGANQHFHSIIWSKCFKEISVSRNEVHLGVAESVFQFGEGCCTN